MTKDELRARLDAAGVHSAPEATKAELQAQVDALPPEPTEDELHERFLATYEPVLTRLPEAVGTSPEQAARTDQGIDGSGDAALL